MTDEAKPLHVLVAEALGWSAIDESRRWAVPPVAANRMQLLVPRYDTDWSATGPLIEAQRIAVVPHSPTVWRALRMPMIGCNDEVYVENLSDSAEGTTPLLAVCALLLRLKEAGKLKIA